MGLLKIFSEMDTLDIIIVVGIIFIVIFLICLSSSLMKKNKVLREELKNKQNIDNIIMDEDIINDKKIENYEDINIIKEDKPEEDNIVVPNEKVDILNELNENLYEDDILSKPEEEGINEILKDLPDNDTSITAPYTRNVLKSLAQSGQTSPVNIGKSAVDVPKVKVTSYVKEEPKHEVKIEQQKLDFEEKDIKKELPKLEENSSNMSNQEFIEEISKRLSEEVEPQTIELTDYEKRQEEEAIISYKELLKVKDRLYKITDDEEIDTFIDELKEFRTNLNEEEE
ncbi:MAG: hypothetical protein MR550_06940 [Bacilli bacterium]|nr:hypothetical protein [Bacilli bacterium]